MCHLLSEFRLTKWCAQKKRRSDERQNTFKSKEYICMCEYIVTDCDIFNKNRIS